MRLFLPIIFCFLLGGCSNKGVADDVIPPPKMQVIIWDMMLADRFSTQFLKDSLKTRIDTQKFTLFHQVFALHSVSKESFISSFNFYMSRPDLSQVMFDSLSRKAERMRPSLYIDSIK